MAKTTATRVTVSTAAFELVPVENVKRWITLIPPSSPQMFFAIDEDGDAIADCRAYQWVPMGTYPLHWIPLEPGQFMWAIADTAGQAPIGVICSYSAPGSGA